MWIGGVRVIVLDDERRVLLVRQHHDGRNIWMVPGGGIEPGENSRDAGAREVEEETGLQVKVGKLVWHVEEVSEERGHRFVNFFLAERIGGKLKLGADPEFDREHQVLREVRFVSREEMEHLEALYPEYLRNELWSFLEGNDQGYDAFKTRTYIGEKNHENCKD